MARCRLVESKDPTFLKRLPEVLGPQARGHRALRWLDGSTLWR